MTKKPRARPGSSPKERDLFLSRFSRSRRDSKPNSAQLRVGNLQVGDDVNDKHYTALDSGLVQAMSRHTSRAHVIYRVSPNSTSGSSGSHCTSWVDDQHTFCRARVSARARPHLPSTSTIKKTLCQVMFGGRQRQINQARRRGGVCSSLSSKAPNVASASLPHNKVAVVESNQSQPLTQHGRCQFSTKHGCFLIQTTLLKVLNQSI